MANLIDQPALWSNIQKSNYKPLDDVTVIIDTLTEPDKWESTAVSFNNEHQY